MIDLVHGDAVKPACARLIVVDVIQDDPAVDMSVVRWEAGYPGYDEAASTSTNAGVLVKFAAATGNLATGRTRIFLSCEGLGDGSIEPRHWPRRA